jgi:drug/metabolite transporter (DMT)-like permease
MPGELPPLPPRSSAADPGGGDGLPREGRESATIPAAANLEAPMEEVADHLLSVADILKADHYVTPDAPGETATPLLPVIRPPARAEVASPVAPSPVAAPPIASIPAAKDLTGRPAARVGLVAGGIVFALLVARSMISGDRSVTWLALLGMNVVGTAGFNLMLRRSAWKHADQWLTAAVLQTGLWLPFLATEIVKPITFPSYTPADAGLLGLAVAALIGLQYCNVKALEHLEASVFSVIYNSRILFITLLGTFFLSEAIGIWALLGGGFIFLAIFIVRQKSTRAASAQGVIFALGAALSMSVMNTCEKELIRLVGYEQYIFPMFTIAAVIMWTIVLLRRTPQPLQIFFQPQSYALMILRACAGIGFSYSLVFGPVAVSSYISSLSVVLLVVFGMLFLGERDYLKSKIAATAVAIIGLTLILIDHIR